MDWNARRSKPTASPTSCAGGGDEAFDFDRLEYAAASLAEHLADQLHGRAGEEGELARMIAEMLDETGYLTVPLADIAEATGAPLALVERALAMVQGLDPPGVGARSLAECLALQAKAADRYDPAMARLIDNLDLLSKGRTADLKRICGVDDEDLADMVRELRAYDPKPGCRFSASAAEDVDARRVRAHGPRSGYAVELNQATLPRAAGQPPLLPGTEERAAGQGVEGLAQRMPGQRQLAGESARPARADDRQGGERDRQAPAGLLRARRVGAEADDPARSRRSDRDARIDRQPRDLEQISAVRPRAVRAQIFLRLGRRVGREARAPRPKRSRRRSAS